MVTGRNPRILLRRNFRQLPKRSQLAGYYLMEAR
jgi:hypothetical protein